MSKKYIMKRDNRFLITDDIYLVAYLDLYIEESYITELDNKIVFLFDITDFLDLKIEQFNNNFDVPVKDYTKNVYKISEQYCNLLKINLESNNGE